MTWINLMDITLDEISQVQKAKYPMISPTYEIKNNKFMEEKSRRVVARA